MTALHKASQNAFPPGELRLAYEELRSCCIRRPGATCEVRKEFLVVALDVLASVIEAQRAETTEIGSVADESAVGEAETPKGGS
jgi:hypothetical protein